jgi:hypothetical protein
MPIGRLYFLNQFLNATTELFILLPSFVLFVLPFFTDIQMSYNRASLIRRQQGWCILIVQQRQTSHSWKIATYHIANMAGAITIWIWSSIIIAVLVQFVSNLLTTKDNGGTLTKPRTNAAISSPPNLDGEKQLKNAP